VRATDCENISAGARNPLIRLIPKTSRATDHHWSSGAIRVRLEWGCDFGDPTFMPTEDYAANQKRSP